MIIFEYSSIRRQTHPYRNNYNFAIVSNRINMFIQFISRFLYTFAIIFYYVSGISVLNLTDDIRPMPPPSQVSGKPEDVCVGTAVSVYYEEGEVGRCRGTVARRNHVHISRHPRVQLCRFAWGTPRSRLLEYNTRGVPGHF